jgi:Flp pilus assembly pilin Flp
MDGLIREFMEDETGAQMAEYALLLVLIGLLLVAAALYLSDKIGDAFQAVADCIANNENCPTSE